MIQYTLRLAKRFAVLIPGIVIAYLSVDHVLPFVDRRVPLPAAIVVTYILAAYLLVPAILRTWRILFPPSHLPLYCVTPDGFASDPLNVGIIATRREIIMAMGKAGWHLADRHIPRNVVKAVMSVLLERPYPTAPVSSLYLFGRKQDLAFERHEGGKLTSRHHVRFWATTYEKRPKGGIGIHGIHWHHRREHLEQDNLLWVGAASFDVGLALIRHNLQLTHMIDPDTNKERELIVQNLKTAGLVKKVKSVKLGTPYRLVNRVWRGFLHSDGDMAVVELKVSHRKN